MDPDRPLLLRTVFLTTAAFTVLAVIVALRQMSEAGAGPGVGLAIVVAGAALGMLVGFGVFRLVGTASGGVVQTLFSARGLPAAPSFSLQEAMIAQGRFRDAEASFREHLAAHADDHDARLALAALLAGPLADCAAAESHFRAVRDGRPTERQEITARQGLIDLYAATAQTGRQMAELARLADRYPGTAAARAAREAVTALKASSPDAQRTVGR